MFTLFSIFSQNMRLHFFGTVKMLKAPAGFEFMTNKFVTGFLTYCATLLDNILLKEVYFVVYINRNLIETSHNIVSLITLT